MKKRYFFGILLFLATCLFSGCFGGVVPCAWVRLNMEGHIYYSSNMYASGGNHIYFYENDADAEGDTYFSNCALTIVFYPRILGADTVNGVKTTTVDISSDYSMTVNVYKGKSIFSDSKKVYLNGEELQPSHSYESSVLLALTFNDFTLTRGNPNGHFNEFVNVIEYK